MALARSSPRDPKTGCAIGEKTALQTFVIVDRTDPWPEAQATLLHDALSNIARSANADDRLTLIPFDGSAEHSAAPLFDKCKSDETATGFVTFFKTPARVEKAHLEHFVKPLEASLAAVTKPSRAKETHLVEFLAALAGQIQYQTRAAKTRAIIFSDMAENTPAFSVYAAKGKPPFSNDQFAKHFAAHMRERLASIALEIYQMPPSGGSRELERRIKAAWTTAFTNSTIEFSIKEF